MSFLLVVLGSRDWPEPRIRDHNGVVRLVLPDSSFEDCLELAAGQLRIYGKRDIYVMLRLVDMLIQVQRESTGRRNVQKTVAEQAARLKEAGEQGLELECDRLRMRKALDGLNHSQFHALSRPRR